MIYYNNLRFIINSQIPILKILNLKLTILYAISLLGGNNLYIIDFPLLNININLIIKKENLYNLKTLIIISRLQFNLWYINIFIYFRFLGFMIFQGLIFLEIFMKIIK